MNASRSVGLANDPLVALQSGTPLWPSPTSHLLNILIYLAPVLLVICGQRLFFRSSSQVISDNSSVPKHWRAYHWPIIGSSIAYFTKRKDMILKGRDTVPGRYFSFFVGSKHVVALSGLQGRQTFFDNKQLNLAQG